MFLEDEGLNNMMGLDEPMEQFMYRFVNSFIKWELINYFHEHPKTAFKILDLSKALNRSSESIKREVQELAEEGLLHASKNGKKIEYSYLLSTEHPKERALHEVVNQFIHLCRTREGRLRVIYKILKNGKPVNS